jgi:hypothetical protein
VQLALKSLAQQTPIRVVVNHSEQANRTLVKWEIKVDLKLKNLLGVADAVAEVKIFVKCCLEIQYIEPIRNCFKF